MSASRSAYDVIVVGGGNAGLVAAISARTEGRHVLLLEAAPQHMRGGNSRHTRNIRYVHPERDGYTSDAYTADELLADLADVGGGLLDPGLAAFAVNASESIPEWMTAHGALWQQPLRGTLHLSRTNRFFLGGGKALMNSYYRTAEKLGVEIRYNARVEDVLTSGNCFEAVLVTANATTQKIRGRAAVIAAGGFEANLEWLKRYWGPAAENFVVRGTPYNDGGVLDALLRNGACSVGDPKRFHSVSVDARGPRVDGGIATRLDSIPFGIVVNRLGARFYDEGEEIWPKRYAIWGRLTAEQPGQIAYSIVDADAVGHYMPTMYPPITASSIPELADKLDIDASTLVRTVTAYNTHIDPSGKFDPTGLDSCRTVDLTPPKSHWARALSRPPYHAYPLRPGITFTYMGVAVDRQSRIVREDGTVFDNLYAAGEIMAGNILSQGYLAGIGMTIGTVFGRLAGSEAARDGKH